MGSVRTYKQKVKERINTMTKKYVVLFGIENLKENRKRCAEKSAYKFNDIKDARWFARYHEDALIWRIKNNSLKPLLTDREIAENRRIWNEVYELCTI